MPHSQGSPIRINPIHRIDTYFFKVHSNTVLPSTSKPPQRSLSYNLNIELKKKSVSCYVWRIDLYGSETWTLRKLELKYFESFEIWCWKKIEKIKWSEKVKMEQVFEHIENKRTLINT